MDKVAIELLAAIATDDELLVIKGTLDALKKLGEGSGIVEMFKTQSYKYKAGNFQVSAVTMQNNQPRLQEYKLITVPSDNVDITPC